MNIEKKHLSVNPYSRPGKPLRGVKGIIWHWAANPGTSAAQNIRFFENRKDGKSGYGSAHLFVDADGKISECVPLDEIAYHVGAKTYMPGIQGKLGSWPNAWALGIELCHPDWTGRPTPETVKAALDLSAELLSRYGLDQTDLYRHYDVTGKNCPRWYVKMSGEWGLVKEELARRLK